MAGRTQPGVLGRRAQVAGRIALCQPVFFLMSDPVTTNCSYSSLLSMAFKTPHTQKNSTTHQGIRLQRPTQMTITAVITTASPATFLPPAETAGRIPLCEPVFLLMLNAVGQDTGATPRIHSRKRADFRASALRHFTDLDRAAAPDDGMGLQQVEQIFDACGVEAHVASDAI